MILTWVIQTCCYLSNGGHICTRPRCVHVCLFNNKREK